MTSARPVVLISNRLLGPVQPVLEAQGYDVRRFWDYEDAAEFLNGPGRDIRAIVHAGEMKLDMDLLAAMPSLGLIACVSVGYDGIDVPACRARGIEVSHAPSTNAEDVADQAVGMMLAGWRGIVAGDAAVRGDRWNDRSRISGPRRLRGLTAGVLGLGHIGEAIARRIEPMGLSIQWWGPRPKPSAAWPMAAGVHELASASDILFVASRAESANRHLVDRAVIEAVGPDGMIVNVARGSLIDEDALIGALRDGRLGKAALDVFAQEPTPAERWRDVPNVVLTPHTAGSTEGGVPEMIAAMLENLRRFFAGEPLASPVRP